MHTALRTYNIFFWNSTLKEKPGGTIPICRLGAGQPKPVMLKATGRKNLLTFKLNKMHTQKMSLANIKGKLSRAEMKNIMAGSSQKCGDTGCTPGQQSTCPSTCPCTNGNNSWTCQTK